MFVAMIQGFHRTHWDNITVTLGLYGDNGKEDGNYYMVVSMFFSMGTVSVCVRS